MKNRTDVHFDGVCVYVNSFVGAALIGKIVILLINLICWTVFILIAMIAPAKEFIIPSIIIFFSLIFGLGRYTAWNFSGAEFIRINTKSLSFSRTYGIVKTKEKVIPFRELSVNYERIRFFDGVEHGRLIFFDYDELNNPVDIFQTTVLISKNKIDEILQQLENLYFMNTMNEGVETEICLN